MILMQIAPPLYLAMLLCNCVKAFPDKVIKLYVNDIAPPSSAIFLSNIVIEFF